MISIPANLDAESSAGTIKRAPATERPMDWFDEVLEVDLTSTFALTQILGITSEYGRVIFTASLLSFQVGINVLGYMLAKSGVAGLVRALSNDMVGAWCGRQWDRSPLQCH